MNNECSNCRFWTGPEPATELRGDCRRYPPARSKDGSVDGNLWPVTMADDWCGEWESGKSLVLCKVCGRRVKGNITREFCSAACKQRDHRSQVAEAKRYYLEDDMTIEGIAAKMGKTVEVIQNWLSKEK